MKKEQFLIISVDDYLKLIEDKNFYPKKYRRNSFSKLLFLYKNSYINMCQYHNAYNKLMSR